ncbi:ABC transporter ATP-binding protein [Candidatus Arthromitus sp. SFB-turkey]|uniref:ABC transporter ATP-binding protein n=1 Tax=Candidatus Arthromitus sp. SFB-turkey TaxID=1840217 RepID=UPI0007F46260|nr:ABC transporter ATP-binding protein [Candidatus Arthromitus sp. SFB-turkey]OAT87229.1 ABC transporter ATP-binding protein [Candidatus Arthromitus sp. SFB-turkey]
MKVVEMKNITKRFPGMIANKNINFDLEKKEIHVLLGENGAGKTTLMNILYGIYTQDEGDIFINGSKIKIKNPKDAISNGIGMVHQHFMLVHNFTVMENIVLGCEPVKSGIIFDKKSAFKKVKEIIDKYEFNIDPEVKIEDISVGQQQKVEILKILYRGADIIILDEPTAVLIPSEIKELEIIMKNLTKEGKSIILITHKLKEVMSMSNRVTIIRRGELIDNLNTKDTSIDELANLMVGRPVNLNVYKQGENKLSKILEVKDLKAKDSRGVNVLKGVSFNVQSGEIFGIAGVAGNGQSELVEVITGIRKCYSGKIIFDGENIENLTPREIIDKKISSIPEDRHKTGLILQHSLYENSILGMQNDKKFKKGMFLDYKSIRKHALDIIEEFDVRTVSENVEASKLSGGNQQKLIVGREIYKNPKLIIAVQPTRGLDIGAIEYIHKRLIKERDSGKAVLLVSLELDEVLGLSDRIGVMYDGNIVKVLDRCEFDENKVGVLMAGGSIDG